MTGTLSDTVCVHVPPLERSSEVVRMATTAMATQAGLNLDQADDLNTAIDELFRLSISDHNKQHTFCVRYEVHPDRLEVVAEGIKANLGDESSKVGRYRRFIIEKVADRFEESSNPEGGFDILLVKFLTH